MNWEYKVLTTNELMFTDQSHDIAVSRNTVDKQRDSSKKELEKFLNNLGSEGWEFVTVIGDFSIFKREGNTN